MSGVWHTLIKILPDSSNLYALIQSPGEEKKQTDHDFKFNLSQDIFMVYQDGLVELQDEVVGSDIQESSSNVIKWSRYLMVAVKMLNKFFPIVQLGKMAYDLAFVFAEWFL